MKKLFTSIICALPLLGFGQNILLYNDGAMVKVQPGAILYVQGGIQNTSTGTIDNDGIIELEGNFVNAGTWEPSQSNTLRFSGSGNSDVTAGSAIFQKVEDIKTGGGNINLLSNMTIDTNLNFNSPGASRIVTGNFDLKLGSNATVIGSDGDEYVATTGTGMMQKNVIANGAFTFPIGDITNYSPLACTYTGTGYSNANLRAKANDLTHPNKPTDGTDFISRYWDINQTGITTYSNTLTGTYIPADINGSGSLVNGAVYSGTEWFYLGSSGNGTSTVTGQTDIATADFTGTDFMGKVDLKVFLEGAFNGTNGMTTVFSNNATIEAQMLTSPYLDAPATVADVPSNVTDWVKLEMRDPANPATVYGKASAFLKSDGTIVATDGVSKPLIKNGVNNSTTAIVGIVHRTHMSIRTPNTTGINVVSPTQQDFTTNLALAYDNPAISTNDAEFLHVASGKYLMYAGNGNANTNVRFGGPANDRDYLLNTVLLGNPGTILTNAYAPPGGTGDYNMNGTVRFGGPNNDRDYLLNTVLGGAPGTILNQHY